MKKAWIGIVAVVLLAGIYLAYSVFSTRGSGFPYGHTSAEFQIRPKQSDATVGQRSVFLVNAGDIEGEVILTPVPSAVEGEAMIDSLVFGVKSAFQERPAPYGGQITALIACDSQKYVEESVVPFAGKEARVVKAVASGRKIYGSCSAPEIKYASVFLAGFDEAKNLVVATKLFKPVAILDEIPPAQEALLKTVYQVFDHR